MHLVKVVVPLYKTVLNQTELFSLKQSVSILKNHKFTIVCPYNLDVSNLEIHFENVDFEVKRFDDEYFKSIDGYNRLMLSGEFYSAFSDSQYILICQTDVFVFRDELTDWCKKDFDYIGAPWLASKRSLWNKSMLKTRNFFNKKKKSGHHFFKVGNGGFSLRKVKTMLEIVQNLKKEIQFFQKNRDEKNFYQEDVFISLYAPKIFPQMKIPDFRTAALFCLDRKPKIGFELNKGQFPFACHGFDKPKVKKFWISKIVEFNFLK